MVEMALTLPLFFALVLGIIEFGQAFMVQQIVTNAAREGARHGVLPGATNAGVAEKVRGHLAAGNLDVPEVTVTITPTDLSTATTGTVVTVRVAAPYDAVGWMTSPWFLSGTNMASQCVMRHE
jgi:Flp pilus assembly protein TadG